MKLIFLMMFLFRLEKNILIIKVKEQPIIDSVTLLKGLQPKNIIKQYWIILKLKSRSVHIMNICYSKKLKNIKSILKNFGFYFATVEPYVEKLSNNLIKIVYKIELGDNK